MINTWWVTRPKRKLDSIPEVLTVFAEISLAQKWEGSRSAHMSFEEALEQSGLKRIGSRRDQRGSGGRTYAIWLESLGLIFRQETTGYIQLTLAGEAIIAGEPPVEVLKNQVLKYQFPSAFSIGRNVAVNERFHICPFRFLLRLLMDSDIQYLTQEEIGRVVIEEAENETEHCYKRVKQDIINYRSYGVDSLPSDFHVLYNSSRTQCDSQHPFRKFDDIANTIINWLEYTQLARRYDKRLYAVNERRSEINSILSANRPLIDRPESHEYFQRRYGLDPKHHKDTRNLEHSVTVTANMIMEGRVKQCYIALSIKRPITSITLELIKEISERVGAYPEFTEKILMQNYPHGSIGGFMNAYYEMAFKGRDEAVDFEKATTQIFQDVFGFTSTHLGQTGSLPAPDVLIFSDEEGYQAIIDNKAYSRYSITNDHRNRMLYSYLMNINRYSSYSYPIGFFSYIAGGFIDGIDGQIRKIHNESGVNGSAITVASFIKMIQNSHKYSHSKIKEILSVNRQVSLNDL